jgi:hypothetical protein
MVDADDPKVGMRRIVEKAGWEDSLWAKRKRFFRLPGEASPATESHGDYASNPATFLRLAHAAGDLLAPTGREETVARERERAVRALLHGTSFLPTFVPTSSQERTAKDLLDDYAARVGAAVSTRTRIAELWKVLRTTPFDISGLDADEARTCGVPPYGDASIFPNALLRPHFRDFIVEARFECESWSRTDWASPILSLGFIAFRHPCRVFRLPTEVASLFDPNRENDDGFYPEAEKWLRSIGFDGRFLPDVDYHDELGFGWQAGTRSALQWIGLEVGEGGDGEPKIRLAVFGDQNRLAYSIGRGGLDSVEEQIATTHHQVKSQARFGQFSTDHSILIVHDTAFDLNGDSFPPVVGLDEDLWMEVSELSGWTDDEACAGLLLSDDNPFFPTAPHCEPIGVPFRQRSLGAALAHNLQVASVSTSVPEMLIERARLTADSGLRFYEAMVDDFRNALQRI